MFLQLSFVLHSFLCSQQYFILCLCSNFPAFLFNFFQIFFWRYRQPISFSSFSVAKSSSELEFFLQCMILFSQSEIRYFILQELSLSQNDSSNLPFANTWSIIHLFMLKNRTFWLHTLNLSDEESTHFCRGDM